MIVLLTLQLYKVPFEDLQPPAFVLQVVLVSIAIAFDSEVLILAMSSLTVILLNTEVHLNE